MSDEWGQEEREGYVRGGKIHDRDPNCGKPGSWWFVPLTYTHMLEASIHPTAEQVAAYEQSAAFLEDSFEVGGVFWGGGVWGVFWGIEGC
jgi:hypothetical protein